MFPVRSFFLLCIYPTVFTIKDMLKINKICDLLSEETSTQCYIKDNLASLAHSPNQLAVSQSNTLYFSFDSGQGEYLPALLNLDTKKLTVLKGVKDAFAISRDSETDEIYFGGSHGIYKYDPTFKTLKKLGVNNLDIWWIQVKEKLYFIKFPSLKVYYYENKTFKPLTELKNMIVHQFVFDDDNNIFFINSSGLFGIKHGENNVIFLKDNPKFLGMAVDNSGHVHLCSENGIYVISKMVQKVRRIVSVQGVLGITFDKDNRLIYSDSREIVRLKPVSREEYYNIDNNSI
ncbi:ommochrome-binding protein-like [Maniola hyperantus]|uniref:ommochrome-binding protein-like n=1 Tax=Aphantopus hyperantus TaxID=2795564 RepID=UPI00156A0C27|nr:ommochrome-binding protein-like [Maniola hyperantus]